MIESIFNEKFNSRVYNNKYIKTKKSPYNENFHGKKRLTKNKYYGHSILLIESTYELKNKYYPQTFLDNFFECNSIECNSVECNSVENSLFKALVQIVDWSDDESNDKSKN